MLTKRKEIAASEEEEQGGKAMNVSIRRVVIKSRYAFSISLIQNE